MEHPNPWGGPNTHGQFNPRDGPDIVMNSACYLSSVSTYIETQDADPVQDVQNADESSESAESLNSSSK